MAVGREVHRLAVETAPEGYAAKPAYAGGGESGGKAKLTGMVNIAVFATFSFCAGCHLRSDAAFKPCGADRQLDVSCYGRQKRQDRGKKWQRMATWAAKTARM